MIFPRRVILIISLYISKIKNQISFLIFAVDLLVYVTIIIRIHYTAHNTYNNKNKIKI